MGIAFAAAANARKRQQIGSPLEHAFQNDAIETWPVISSAWLEAAIPRLSEAECELLLRHKLMPFAWGDQQTLYAVGDDQALAFAQERGLSICGRILPEDYRRLLRRHFAPLLVRQATFGLLRRRPWASARHRLSPWQSVFSATMALLSVALIMIGDAEILMVMVQCLACLFFLIVVLLRGLCTMPPPQVGRSRALALYDDELPIYTVLVPLFRETSVLAQLTASLGELDYPSEKLDIKIILEADDRAMREAVASIDLPPHFDVVIVPRGKPQTKPRALNYAMHFARGSLVTIFDGEDIPQSNQLRLAASEFARLPHRVACLQAALDLYNPAENWLTRQFAAEYAGLFHVILPALSAYHLPLPLGGTSNHFRVKALRGVGGWDPFNVTEDADLGIRLSRHGYATGTLKSATFEEAPSHLSVWAKQRRRWLKGFLQTWLVHNRNPMRLLRDLGPAGFATAQVMTIGIFASALLHPLLLVLTLWKLQPSQLPTSAAGFLLSGLGVAVLVMGYATAMLTCRQGLKHIGASGWTFTLLTIPVYWLIMSFAAWMALWDFFVAPFHWHKTSHGLSRFTQTSRPARRGFTSRQ
jgi:glycosyltransferase XagB